MGIQNLDQRFPIVNPNGTPSDYFMRILRDRGSVTEELENTKVSTSRVITAGVGLSGGGDLSEDRTIDLEDTTVAPGSYTNTDLTVDAQGRILAAANGASGAGGLVLVDSWTWSSNVANVDFTDLTDYSEIIVVVYAVTSTAGGQRSMRMSTDNGATFDTSAGNFQSIADTGAPTGTTTCPFHNTGSTSARYGIFRISGLNLNGQPKIVDRLNVWNSTYMYVGGSFAPVDAIRIYDSSGNLSGGSIYIYGRA